MQQKPNNLGRMIPMLILYAAFTVYIFYFMPRNNPAPQQTQSILAQAQALETQGRTNDPNVALADRVKKLEQAIGKYQEYYDQNKSTPEGMQARFQQVNIYDYLAQLEGKKSGTHWYDQSEARLKEMEKDFHNRTGEVKVEVVGQVQTQSGNLGKIASERLNGIRAARDQVNQGNITYRVLDFLVKLCGGRQFPGFSYFMALALVVIVLKVATFPFQKKQYQSQRDMMRIQPLIKEMQEKMKGRPPEETQRRMMQIYKENNVSMTAGCLPMLVTAFALFPVFWMVRDYEYQFTNGHFLWIGSAYAQKVWWLADHLAQFDVPLFVIYLLSTVGYSLLQPKPADPQQAQQQKMMMIMMPVMFGVMMWQGQWSSAFMLYWLVLNIVSMYQSWVLNRQLGMHDIPMTSASPSSGGGGGNGRAEVPAAPLEPMKGVTPRKPKSNRVIRSGQNGGNGKSGQNGKNSGGAPGQVRPVRDRPGK